MPILVAAVVGGAVAPRFGCPGPEGMVLASVLVLALGKTWRSLVAGQPGGRRRFFRWLMAWTWGAGSLAVVWSATHVRYDRWFVFWASLHVLLMIALALVPGWVTDARGVARVTFGTAAKPRKKPKSADWFDDLV